MPNDAVNIYGPDGLISSLPFENPVAAALWFNEAEKLFGHEITVDLVQSGEVNGRFHMSSKRIAEIRDLIP